MDLWKKYIAFEKSNPLRSEDTALVTRRVMFATEQCLLVLTHHPAVWHQAAQYLDQSSKLLTEKGVRIFCVLLLRCNQIEESIKYKTSTIGFILFPTGRIANKPDSAFAEPKIFILFYFIFNAFQIVDGIDMLLNVLM